jgi:hypothetical protein
MFATGDKVTLQRENFDSQSIREQQQYKHRQRWERRLKRNPCGCKRNYWVNNFVNDREPNIHLPFSLI